MTQWLSFEFIPGYRRPDHPWKHEYIEVKTATGDIQIWKYADIPPDLNIHGCFWRPSVRRDAP